MQIYLEPGGQWRVTVMGVRQFGMAEQGVDWKRASWSIKGIQGPWKEEKRGEEREGRRETGQAPPTS